MRRIGRNKGASVAPSSLGPASPPPLCRLTTPAAAAASPHLQPQGQGGAGLPAQELGPPAAASSCGEELLRAKQEKEEKEEKEGEEGKEKANSEGDRVGNLDWGERRRRSRLDEARPAPRRTPPRRHARPRRPHTHASCGWTDIPPAPRAARAAAGHARVAVAQVPPGAPSSRGPRAAARVLEVLPRRGELAGGAGGGAQDAGVRPPLPLGM